MTTNSSFQKIIIGVVAVACLGGAYYFFGLSSQTDASSQGIDKTLLNKKVVDFLSVKDRIDLKDSSFLKSTYYSELVDYSEVIPMTTKRGRDNPFIPYVAPGSIR